MNKITSVCVYCASSTKIDSAYFEAARELGTLLGQRHIRLINGAGGIGLMSATADAVLADLSDAVIALPGGCGTLEELLEIITWKQLGLYLNPVVILNTNSFFDPLLAMLQRAMDENFMRQQHGAIWYVASTPQEAVELIHTIPVWDSSIRKFAAI